MKKKKDLCSGFIMNELDGSTGIEKEQLFQSCTAEKVVKDRKEFYETLATLEAKNLIVIKNGMCKGLVNKKQFEGMTIN